MPGSAAGTNAYTVTVTATDSGGLTATQTVTVNVTNVNEAPSFAAPTATFSTPENSTSVGTITAATDPDGGIPLLTPYRELMQLSLILMLPAVFSALRLLPILKCQVVQREPMPIPSQSPLLMVVG